MGMFDEIKCEYPLPNPEVQDCVFQTKSLERALDQYTITQDGRLILHQVRWEPVPEEERPYYGKPEWNQPLGQFIGSLKTVPVGDMEIPYHGDIVFYERFEKTGEWYEYRARFTDGRVQWIKRVGDDPARG